jgi:hypothetical protein
MKVKPQGKAGLVGVNPNETLVRVKKPTQGLKVKSHIKAGAFSINTNIAALN